MPGSSSVASFHIISSPDILSEEDLNLPTESYPLIESSLMMPLRFPGSCKDHACSDGTTCHLVKHKPECVASTKTTFGSDIVFSSKTISLKDLETASISSSKTMAVAKPGSESTPEAEPGLVAVTMAYPGFAQGVLNEPQPESIALVEPEPGLLSVKEPIPETLTVALSAPVLLPLPMPIAEPESKPKIVSGSRSETVSVAKLGLKVVAGTEPGLEAVTMAKQELETVSGSKMVSQTKSETVGVSSKRQGGVPGGTCWASGLPYIYTFDGNSFPVPGGCTYILSHCPQALPSGLPAFQLWIACSGGRQPMRFVTMRAFGITITAVKHEFGFVRVRIIMCGILGNCILVCPSFLSTLQWRQLYRSTVPYPKGLGPGAFQILKFQMVIPCKCHMLYDNPNGCHIITNISISAVKYPNIHTNWDKLRP